MQHGSFNQFYDLTDALSSMFWAIFGEYDLDQFSSATESALPPEPCRVFTPIVQGS